MVLSDRDIRLLVTQGRLGITPFRDEQVQPASYDFRLGKAFLETRLLDPMKALHLLHAERDLVATEAYQNTSYCLEAGGTVLALSDEVFRLPDSVAGQIRCKSSLGRLFLTLTSDACWFDPGFEGQAVIEICNHNRFPIWLEAGQKIGQMTFHTLTSPAEHPYRGNYQKQDGFVVNRWLAALRKLGEGVIRP